MLYYEIEENIFIPWTGEPINEVQHPTTIESVWTEADLNQINLYHPTQTEIPEGKYSISSEVKRVDGVVRFVHELEDIPPPQEQIQLPSQPILYAAAQLKVQDYEVTGVGINSRLGGAFWGDVGKYYVFFAESQPDTDYIVMTSSPALNCYVLEEEKTEDMFVITTTDPFGDPVDATTVNIQILRTS